MELLSLLAFGSSDIVHDNGDAKSQTNLWPGHRIVSELKHAPTHCVRVAITAGLAFE